MQGRPPDSYGSKDDNNSTNTLIIVLVITVVFILLGMFSYTSKPQSDNGLPDGVDKYGRSTQSQSQ